MSEWASKRMKMLSSSSTIVFFLLCLLLLLLVLLRCRSWHLHLYRIYNFAIVNMLAPNSGIFTFIANDVLISQNVNQFVYICTHSLTRFWFSLLCMWLSGCLFFSCYFAIWPFQFDWALILMPMLLLLLYVCCIYYKTILLPSALPLTIRFQSMEIKLERQRQRQRWQCHCCGSTHAHANEHHLYKYLCEEECAKNLSKFK